MKCFHFFFFFANSRYVEFALFFFSSGVCALAVCSLSHCQHITCALLPPRQPISFFHCLASSPSGLLFRHLSVCVYLVSRFLFTSCGFLVITCYVGTVLPVPLILSVCYFPIFNLDLQHVLQFSWD